MKTDEPSAAEPQIKRAAKPRSREGKREEERLGFVFFAASFAASRLRGAFCLKEILLKNEEDQDE